MGLLNCSDKDLQMYYIEYHQMFNDEVLGNPTASQKQEHRCTEMAIDYYMQYGLKFAHRFSSEPNNEWFYASWDEGGKIRFENCLNN